MVIITNSNGPSIDLLEHYISFQMSWAKQYYKKQTRLYVSDIFKRRISSSTYATETQFLTQYITVSGIEGLGILTNHNFFELL